MKKYPKYKFSGLEWVGEIPSNWKVLRNKYFIQSKVEKSTDGSEELLSVSEYRGVVPRGSIREDDEHLTRSESLEGYLKVSPGELVCNIMLMWKRGLGVSEYFGIVSPAYSVFEFKFGIPKYYHYLFRTDLFISEFKRNSRGVIDSRLRLYDDEFGYISSLLPPLPEQQAIVSFLDEKTSQIDTLISNSQKKIELLKEKRTALINQVVTKGLDPKSKMKDSGVEWIGEIPVGWSVIKLNRVSSKIGDGLHGTPAYSSETNNYFINGNNIKEGKIFISDSTKEVDISEYQKYYIELYPEKTLLLSINGTIGNVAFFNNEQIILGKSVCYINLEAEDVNLRFLFHYLSSYTCQSHFLFESTGTTIFNLSLASIRDLKLILPSSSEQQKIAEYLDHHTSEIDKEVSLEEKRIELLKEYRQSLISEVVTGKINVTDYAN